MAELTTTTETYSAYLDSKNPGRRLDRVKFYIGMSDSNGNKLEGGIPIGDGKETTVEEIVLHINPTTASFNLSKIINRTQTMTGWIEEHWGEELDTITFQGSSAAFLVSGGTGGDIRRESASYIKMRQWLQYMYTNGMMYEGGSKDFPTINDGRATNRRYIRIYHDYGMYIGYFESFDLTEDAATPFRFTYTVTFKSEKTIFNYLK